jgi:hypothetical protein
VVVNWDEQGDDGEVSVVHDANVGWVWEDIGVGPWNDDVVEKYVEDDDEGNPFEKWGFDAITGDEGMSSSSTILSSSSMSSKQAFELDRDLWRESIVILVPLLHPPDLDEGVCEMGVLHGRGFLERPRLGVCM